MPLLRLAPLLALLLVMVLPAFALADERDEDLEDDEVLIQRLPDSMYEMIRDRFPDADIQRATLEIEGDEVEFEVRLVSKGTAYEVEFEAGEDSIDDDNVERLGGDADRNENDLYDDDQHR